MSQENNHILDQINNMIYQCDSFRKIIPADNKQAKLIVANFYDQLIQLRNTVNSKPNEYMNKTKGPLTGRELEIIEHVSNGFTNK